MLTYCFQMLSAGWVIPSGDHGEDGKRDPKTTFQMLEDLQQAADYVYVCRGVRWRPLPQGFSDRRQYCKAAGGRGTHVAPQRQRFIFARPVVAASEKRYMQCTLWDAFVHNCAILMLNDSGPSRAGYGQRLKSSMDSGAGPASTLGFRSWSRTAADSASGFRSWPWPPFQMLMWIQELAIAN